MLICIDHQWDIQWEQLRWFGTVNSITLSGGEWIVGVMDAEPLLAVVQLNKDDACVPLHFSVQLS